MKDLVLGQSKINDSINKKLMANDKILENISEKMDSFSSTIKNQLSFNKMSETQLAQLAVVSHHLNKVRSLGSLRIQLKMLTWSQQSTVSLCFDQIEAIFLILPSSPRRKI